MWQFLTIVFFFSAIQCISAQSHKTKLLYQLDKVKIYEYEENKTEFADASLKLNKFILKQDSSEILVNFSFENYMLGVQSSKDSSNLCANSKDGQHIHFIHDNEPYTALYNGGHKYKATLGHHVFLAFLSRSYHLSLKHPKSFLIHEYNVGAGEDEFNEKKPHLFYSRPKGTYVGIDTQDVLIDYYLINCELAPKGYKVNVNIDDKYKFVMDKWTPLVMNGLQTGEHTIELTLMDKKGRPLNNKYNRNKRKFILAMNPK